MMKTKTLFLKASLLFISLLVLLFSLFIFPKFPHAMQQEYPRITYENWAFIGGLYLSELCFYFAVFQAFRVLRQVDHNQAFSQETLLAVTRLKQGLFGMGGSYLTFLPFLYVMADVEDAPGLIFVGLGVIAVPFIAAVFVAILQKLLENVLLIKTENELTI
ncbi:MULTISPECIES: DUF2975 domain-containing protein [Enterococcus]|uniref:DUF2975 domain-containing protein n=1 Tax=Enterococcus TaxID=1350 RepID=UPI0010F923D6|nr:MULTISPECIES: DUF2975 domain-containing protein [Enterococcus]